MSITTELPQTVTEPAVTVFSKNDCPYCDSTKARLTARGVPFREINVQEDTEPRDEFGGLTPLDYVVANYGRSMPVVVVAEDSGNYEESWTGSRPDKTLALIQRFEQLGATIPVKERAAHTGHL